MNESSNCLTAYMICICVVLAGCSTLPTTDRSSGKVTLAEPNNHPGMSPDVDVRIDTTDSVNVEVIELGERGRGTVFNRTYSEVTVVAFGEHEVFRQNGAYRMIIRVDDSVAFDEQVKHFESYDLKVARNGTVIIESHSIA